MGKKRITTTEGEGAAKTAEGVVAPAQKTSSKKRIESGVLCIESTYNNTKVVLTDEKGNTLAWSTSGALGFRGAKKGTPFAAAKIGETLGEKAGTFGIKEVRVIVKGVGSGRESAIRGFISKGINLTTISDMTPVPHNGPKPPKPRRA
jgi:small subunit ribosomal protein S11